MTTHNAAIRSPGYWPTPRSANRSRAKRGAKSTNTTHGMRSQRRMRGYIARLWRIAAASNSTSREVRSKVAKRLLCGGRRSLSASTTGDQSELDYLHCGGLRQERGEWKPDRV